MVIHTLDAAPPPDLQRALEEFEASFSVPFAPGRSYRIDYGADRTAFVRSLGESMSLAAEKDGRVVAFFEMALVSLLTPDGATRPAVYVADVKVLPEARRSITTARVLQKAVAWGKTKSDFWFTVTLEGARQRPPDYTGRAGIPAFSEAGALTVVRIPVTSGSGGAPSEEDRFIATDEEGREAYRRLARGRYALIGRAPEARSATTPLWLVHPGGAACARFEDRRKVRRLIADDGTELRPAYLSCFSFQDPQAGVDIIVAALGRAERLGYRAVRFCLPPSDLAALQRVLGPGVIQGNTGAIYTKGEAIRGALWNLNASEV